MNENKYERIIRLALGTLKLDVWKGHLSWTVADLARQEDTSRSWIYKVLGQNKNDILLNSLKLFLEDFYCLTPEALAQVDELSPHGILSRSQDMVRENPELLTLYFTYRLDEKSQLGKIIKKYEKSYFNRLTKLYNFKDKGDFDLFRIVIHGIIFAPFLSKKECESSLNRLCEYLTKA